MDLLFGAARTTSEQTHLEINYIQKADSRRKREGVNQGKSVTTILKHRHTLYGLASTARGTPHPHPHPSYRPPPPPSLHLFT